MANNVVKVKRTSVSGRTPNTTGSYATNTQYISAGELALNQTDGILYSSNGSVLIEIGSNNTTQNISTNSLTVGTTLYVVSNGNIGFGNSTPAHKARVEGVLSVTSGIHANGSLGSAGQVLTSNSAGIYWSTPSSSGTASRVFSTTTVAASQNTFSTATDFIAGTTDVYLNGIRLSNSEYTEVNTSTIQLTTNPPNGAIIDLSGWSSLAPGGGSVNTNAQYTWSNTQTFSNTVYLNAVSANGSLGTAGQVLTSNGSDTYWSTASGGPGGTSITTEIVTGTTQTAVKDYRYVLTNAAATTVTLPASPSLGDTVYILVANDLANNIVARNGLKIMSLSEDMTLDQQNISIGLVYTNSTLGWRII